MHALRSIVLAALFLAACSPPPATALVDLRTDLTAGRDFYAVHDVLDGPTSHAEQLTPALSGDDFVGGRRVAELAGLAPGAYTLTTELLGLSRTVVVRRITAVSVAHDVALTVVVSRQCVGVACPGTHDDPALTTCAAGHCVDPRCSSVDPSTCPTGCHADTDCTAPAACAVSTCTNGACFSVPGTGCAAGERCDTQTGCVPAMIRCAPSLADCAGACTDTQNDATSCGTCGHACTAPTGGGPTCVAGVCGFACGAGLHHCGGACSAMPCGELDTAPGMTTFTVPEGCTQLDVVAWGAGGGAGQQGVPNPGGAGGFASATLDVGVGEQLSVVVGAGGAAGVGGTGGAGGAPGGGRGGTGTRGGGGGGGYSGVFRGAAAPANALVIAGGGGGAGGGGWQAPAGGGYTGGVNAHSAPPGTQSAGGNDGPPGGGTPSTPGTALGGGNGGNRSDGGGGGGSGWFGGGGANGASSNAAGGGGGSGYVTPTAITFALATGTDNLAGGDGDPRRGTAGDPGRPGLVSLTCR